MQKMLVPEWIFKHKKKVKVRQSSKEGEFAESISSQT